MAGHLDTYICKRLSSNLQIGLGFNLYGSPGVPVYKRLYIFQEWSPCFSQSYVCPESNFPLAFKVRSWEPNFARSIWPETRCGVQNCHNNSRTCFSLLFSSFCVTIPGRCGVWRPDCALLLSYWSSFLGCWVSFFNGFLCPPVNVCLTIRFWCSHRRRWYMSFFCYIKRSWNIMRQWSKCRQSSDFAVSLRIPAPASPFMDLQCHRLEVLPASFSIFPTPGLNLVLPALEVNALTSEPPGLLFDIIITIKSTITLGFIY